MGDGEIVDPGTAQRTILPAPAAAGTASFKIFENRGAGDGRPAPP
jgi:hypothetical protein